MTDLASIEAIVRDDALRSLSPIELAGIAGAGYKLDSKSAEWGGERGGALVGMTLGALQGCWSGARVAMKLPIPKHPLAVAGALIAGCGIGGYVGGKVGAEAGSYTGGRFTGDLAEIANANNR